MSRAAPPHPLTTQQARRIWLAAQRLDTSAPFGAGPQAVADAVAHLGYVQIDTINVIERCHHHILYTRIPDYRRADLRQAQSADKSVFEYWTHALSYVPSADYRFFIPDMKLHRREGHRWFGDVKPADTRKVMRLLKEGALTVRDIEDDVLTEKVHLWASRKPSKRALQLLCFSIRSWIADFRNPVGFPTTHNASTIAMTATTPVPPILKPHISPFPDQRHVNLASPPPGRSP